MSAEYTDSKQPGAPGVGDIVVALGRGAERYPQPAVGRVCSAGWGGWDIIVEPWWLRTRAVRWPTPAELAAYQLDPVAAGTKKPQEDPP